MNNIGIGFAAADDLPQLADLLAELFTLESDFRPDRDRQLRGLSLTDLCHSSRCEFATADCRSFFQALLEGFKKYLVY